MGNGKTWRIYQIDREIQGMSDTLDPKTITELRRALAQKQKKLDRKKLPEILAQDATNAQIVSAVNKILEVLRG